MFVEDNTATLGCAHIACKAPHRGSAAGQVAHPMATGIENEPSE